MQGDASVEHFMFRKNYVIKTESEEVRKNLSNHKVDVYHGIATFQDAHHVRVSGPKEEVIEGEFILIASGSYPFHPANIPFDNKKIHDSDTILNIKKFRNQSPFLALG